MKRREVGSGALLVALMLAACGRDAPPSARWSPPSPSVSASPLPNTDVALETDPIEADAASLQLAAVAVGGHGGAIGDGTEGVRARPVLVDGFRNAVDLGVSATTTCALLQTGAVKCASGGARPPAPVKGVEAKQIAVGNGTCALVADGVTCWSPSVRIVW